MWIEQALHVVGMRMEGLKSKQYVMSGNVNQNFETLREKSKLSQTLRMKINF